MSKAAHDLAFSGSVLASSCAPSNSAFQNGCAVVTFNVLGPVGLVPFDRGGGGGGGGGRVARNAATASQVFSKAGVVAIRASDAFAVVFATVTASIMRWFDPYAASVGLFLTIIGLNDQASTRLCLTHHLLNAWRQQWPGRVSLAPPGAQAQHREVCAGERKRGYCHADSEQTHPVPTTLMAMDRLWVCVECGSTVARLLTFSSPCPSFVQRAVQTKQGPT